MQQHTCIAPKAREDNQAKACDTVLCCIYVWMPKWEALPRLQPGWGYDVTSLIAGNRCQVSTSLSHVNKCCATSRDVDTQQVLQGRMIHLGAARVGT